MGEHSIKSGHAGTWLFKLDLAIYKVLDIFVAKHLRLHNFDGLSDFGICLAIELIALEKGGATFVGGVDQNHVGWASFKLAQLNDVTNSYLA